VTEANDIHSDEGRFNAYPRRLEKEKFSVDDRDLISGCIQQRRATPRELRRATKAASFLPGL
jgi:hypothetical protein